MATGTITKIVADRGFGFIQSAQGEEFFFHRSALRSGTFEGLCPGQTVSFEPGQSPKGPRAEDIRVV